MITANEARDITYKNRFHNIKDLISVTEKIIKDVAEKGGDRCSITGLNPENSLLLYDYLKHNDFCVERKYSKTQFDEKIGYYVDIFTVFIKW